MTYRSKTRSGGAPGDWALVTLLLGAFLPIVAVFALLLGLFVLAVKYRSAAVLLGFMLAIGCGVTGIIFLADPEIEDGIGMVFFPWAGLGVYIVVKALKNK